MVTKPRAAEPANWLLLLHQLPAKPAYARVKLWRRLQALGAVAVKNAVYALPAGPQAQEDFEWALKEITAAGGEGMIVEARLIDGLSDEGCARCSTRARGGLSRAGQGHPGAREGCRAGPGRAVARRGSADRRDRLLRRQRAGGCRGAPCRAVDVRCCVRPGHEARSCQGPAMSG